MKPKKRELIITYEDYDTLNKYVTGVTTFKAFDKNNAAMLKEELRKATIVNKDKFPKDVVRLNSRVVVKEGNKNKLIDLILVTPEMADIKEKKVSVFAPIGTALIGFREGQTIKWEVPSGTKAFKIMKVNN